MSDKVIGEIFFICLLQPAPQKAVYWPINIINLARGYNFLCAQLN